MDTDRPKGNDGASSSVISWRWAIFESAVSTARSMIAVDRTHSSRGGIMGFVVWYTTELGETITDECDAGSMLENAEEEGGGDWIMCVAMV